ncbi:hypothetical protein K438DRAFT_1998906 [Mycena galopus ATCC 62051]|nr:hypothetical protein K438DRAFT_1998906 [Mycena galopus ATCC 62051]
MFRQPNHKTASSSLLQQVKSKMEKMKMKRTLDEHQRAHRDASARYCERTASACVSPSESARRIYYAVWEGRARGVFFDSWIARDQTSGFTDGNQKAFKKWRDVLVWWHQLCHDHHHHGCPPFDPIIFTLDPPSNTHPGTAPCTYAPPAYPATILPVPSPFAVMSTSSSISSLPSSGASSTDSLFLSDADHMPQKDEPVMPTPKLNAPPCVTMTRIQLTPTGKAQGAMIVTAAGTAAPRPSAHDTVPHPNPTTVAATPAQHNALALLMRSVLIMPQPGVTPLALVPAAAAAPKPPYTYCIQGVAVFYPSHAAAWTAAHWLRMTDAKILASRNAKRVQAYMYSLPFDGED